MTEKSSTSFTDQVADYAERLRQRGCDPWCGAGIDAHPIKHRPICAMRILNPPPYPELVKVADHE